MREFKCHRYFIQQQEHNLSELIAEGISFATLDEAKRWIESDDPEKKYAYNIYEIKAEVVHAV
jgi:hypothetical protein